MTAPKLRFKEFDEDWNLSTLANISSIITGSTPSTSNREYYDGEFLFVSPADIQENRYVEKTKTTLTANGFSKCRHIPENSVLFVCIGSTIGKVAQNKVICATNQQINAVIPNKGYSSDFLYVLLEKLAPSIKLNAGVQAVPLINKTEFGKTLLNLPISDEQTKIATFLSAVDEKISQLTQKHQLLSQYKQGMMQKLFSQQIRFKADDGSDFGEWEEKLLSEIGSFKNGLNKDKESFGFGYPFVNLMDVFGKKIVETEYLGLVDATPKDLENYDLRKGDVLFIRSSVKAEGVGQTALVINDLKNVVYSGFLIRFRDSYGLDLGFKKYCFMNNEFRLRLLAKSTTSANTNINQESLSALFIKIPCLEEQSKIANFLSAIDQKIAVVAQQIEQAKQWKKGLLQQMFV